MVMLRRLSLVLTVVSSALLCSLVDTPDTVAAAEMAAGGSSRSSAETGRLARSYGLIHVNAEAGSDRNGDGSQMRPLQTITAALSQAQPNTVIVLAPGEYSAATGEVFPLRLRPGVTVQGSPGGEVVIRGGAQYLSPAEGLQTVAIVAADRAGLGNVIVSNPQGGHGVWIEAGSPVLQENAFVGNGQAGVYIAGGGAAQIRRNYFTQNGEAGLIIGGLSQAEVVDNVFEATGTGIVVLPGATPRLAHNQISQNRDGLVIQANAQPLLQQNQIRQNRRNGVVEFAPSQPALPATTAGEAGPVARQLEQATDAIASGDDTAEITAALGQVPADETVELPEPGTVSSSRSTDLSALRARLQALAPEPEQPVAPAIALDDDDTSPADTALSPAEIASSPLRSQPQSQPALTLDRLRDHLAARQAATAPDHTESVELTVIPPPVTPTVAETATARDIPPEAAQPSAPSPPAPEPDTTLPELPPQARESTPLEVPGARIPLGQDSTLPTLSLSQTVATSVDSPPPPPSRASALGLPYRVLVPLAAEITPAQVRAQVPDAFRVRLNGQLMMQAGAYSDRASAEAQVTRLKAAGLEAQVEYTP